MLKLFFIYILHLSFIYSYHYLICIYNVYTMYLVFIYEKFLWDQNNYVECLSVDDSAAKSFQHFAALSFSILQKFRATT